MNLYHVFDTADRAVVEGFPTRKAAKVKRDALNAAEHGEKLSEIKDGTGLRYIVGRGSDHPNGSTAGPVFHGKKWREPS